MATDASVVEFELKQSLVLRGDFPDWSEQY